MARRGRPPGVDSETTRASIVDAARGVFAERGFSSTTVAALAESAGLAPSAVYHYFGGKAELYEAVFESTSNAMWSELDASVHAHDSLASAVAAMLDNAVAVTNERPHYSAFLALVPVEARLHPGFAHLLDRRSKYQDATFAAMATLGIGTGELNGFTHEQATEMLRSVVMGWMFETHFRGESIPGSRDAVISLFRNLGAR